MYVQDLISDRVTNNLQLNKIGNALFGSDYLGTYSSDQFPKYIRDGQVFILNTESSRKNGEHWVAFAKINKKLYYYDSYSRSKSELSSYWKNRKMINANKTDRDQSYLEDSCGSRSIAFLILIKRFGEKAVNVV
jgi:hypothetical protein